MGCTYTADLFFQGLDENKGGIILVYVVMYHFLLLYFKLCCYFVGNVALSYGGLLHAKQNFPIAKDIYEKVIQGVSETKDLSDTHNLAAGNMALEEALLAATCSLGQLEAHLGLDFFLQFLF